MRIISRSTLRTFGEKYPDAELNSPECDYLDILATLVEDYEKEHYAIEPPDPIEAILYYLETKGLSEQDFLNIAILNDL